MFPETGIFRPVWLGLAWRVILLADYAPRFLHHYDAGLQIRSYRVIAFTAYLVNCGDSRDVYALLCFNNARKIRLRGGFTYKLIATPHRPRMASSIYTHRSNLTWTARVYVVFIEFLTFVQAAVGASANVFALPMPAHNPCKVQRISEHRRVRICWVCIKN